MEAFKSNLWGLGFWGFGFRARDITSRHHSVLLFTGKAATPRSARPAAEGLTSPKMGLYGA